MRRHPLFSRSIGLVTALAMVLASMLPISVAHAGMVSTEQVIAQTSAAADRQAVISFMGREDVRRQMEALGIDPNEAAARVAALSDAEIQQIAGRIDEMPAGASFLESVLIVAAVVFVVLLITDIVGATDVFPFTRNVAAE